MKLSVEADIEKAPQWIKDISSDGILTLVIDKTDTHAVSGPVTHSTVAKIIGDMGSEAFSRSATSGYYNTKLVKSDNEYDWAVMLFTYAITNGGYIDTDNVYVYFTTESDVLSSFSGAEYEFKKKKLDLESF